MRHLTEPAQVRVFKHGTTIPVVTYADRERTIPHTHPVMADVEYVFPKVFLGDEMTDIDMVMSNSKGEPLYITRLVNVQGLAPNIKTRP
jgi:hypothetical protein